MLCSSRIGGGGRKAGLFFSIQNQDMMHGGGGGKMQRLLPPSNAKRGSNFGGAKVHSKPLSSPPFPNWIRKVFFPILTLV